MKEYLIGAGGWAYFKSPKLHPLAAYSKAFNFVEVNSTFYQIPSMREVEKWRNLVPPDFQFAVRAHRTITHRYKLQPTEEAMETFKKMKQICETLNTDILHVQTPPSFKFNPASISDLRDFLSSADLKKLRLALEIRGTPYSNLSPALLKTMQDYGMIHCTDLSEGEMPAYESDILYSRLFGKAQHNIYQLTDEELKQIDRKASTGNSEKIILNFHFVKMYKDAARFKIYKQTGKFPMLTRSIGVSSLGEVLREDAKFPATRQELIRSQGWKLIDFTKEKRMRAMEFLQRLPNRTYVSVTEVIETLKSVGI